MAELCNLFCHPQGYGTAGGPHLRATPATGVATTTPDHGLHTAGLPANTGGGGLSLGGFGTEPCNFAACLAVCSVNDLLTIHEDLNQAFLRRGLPGSRRSTLGGEGVNRAPQTWVGVGKGLN